jgi:hypothetical protein
MTSTLSTKLGIGILVAVLGGGAGIIVLYHNPSATSSSSSSTDVLIPIVPAEVHTANWYVAHPDILKQDEMRCAGDAATISQAACQNAYSADEQRTQTDMQKAAAENGADGVVNTAPGNRAN